MTSRNHHCGTATPPGTTADLGDLVIALLAGTLAGLRDRLCADGFDTAAELVADLVEATDDYLGRLACARGPAPGTPES